MWSLFEKSAQSFLKILNCSYISNKKDLITVYIQCFIYTLKFQ